MKKTISTLMLVVMLLAIIPITTSALVVDDWEITKLIIPV